MKQKGIEVRLDNRAGTYHGRDQAESGVLIPGRRRINREGEGSGPRQGRSQVVRPRAPAAHGGFECGAARLSVKHWSPRVTAGLIILSNPPRL